MKKVYITMFILLISSMATQAQTSKAEKIKNIRAAYAKAKEMIANNGKGGNPALDMHVALRTINEVDEDFIIEEDTNVDFYFMKNRKYNTKEEMFYEENVCYFMVEQWGANGHTRYREMLFDSDTGRLVFSFMKSESHAGFVVETRYYFDSEGKLIEEKLKAGGQDADPSNHLYGDAEGDCKVAHHYLDIFQEIMQPKGDYSAGDGKTAVAQAKDERIKTIRASYAKAKELIESNKKNQPDNRLSIVVHDQEEGDCPPVVTKINYSLNEWDDGQAPMYRCYFISEHTHHNKMGYDQYSEFLLNDKDQRYGDNGKPTKTINPMFSYTCVHEEGEKYEWRYYYDENGRCIETKSNHEDTDEGKADKLKTRRLLHVFNALMNPDV
jgi:hypothetical protein